MTGLMILMEHFFQTNLGYGKISLIANHLKDIIRYFQCGLNIIPTYYGVIAPP